MLLNNKEWLNDNHMTCAQKLIKNQFPQYNGLQNTILQQTKFLKPLLKSLQILHTGETENNRNHWIAVSTVNYNKKEDIIVYDSKFSSSLSPDTLIKTEKSAICIKVANVTKQTGLSDCGLFAIAYITHIAFGMNPSSCVFQQSSMREHFLKCLEDKKMQPFPVSNRKRRTSVSHKIIEEPVYCYCRCPNVGEKMFGCDGICGGWSMQNVTSVAATRKSGFAGSAKR